MSVEDDPGTMTNDAADKPTLLRPLRWSAPTVSGKATAGEEFALPAGTVTFLLTDVEGSTSSWESAPASMGPAIARHYEILDVAVAARGGVRPQEQGEGDSIVAAFGRASDAVLAAVDAQRALGDETWPDGLARSLRVRMAIHTGEAQLRNEANYVGQAIIRTARLRAIAHGRQVLVSQAVRDLVVDHLGDRVELIDLGTHRLKDLARPEHVWQVAGAGLERDFPPLRSLDAVPNNLPTELSTFVGRQIEIAAVCALTKGNRLVTITGSGGAGKTRIAQQVAAQLIDDHPDGTWWIELAPIDASQVRGTIAAAVSIGEPDRLVERLAGRVLLVLDNCEHALDAVGPLVQQILARCPDVSVLATSRGPLDVPGEVTWRVPPLSLPDSTETLTVERLAQYEAVQLFIDRARRARPNFALTNENGPAVAELCARLDGIPLALELAAARAKSLTAEQILRGLDDSLRLLTGGSRLVMPRQQTLEASIAWSHDLLGGRERTLLRRLTVFAGGWDLEAAEAVCADDALAGMDVLDSLEHLIDQSLVRVDEARGAARYELLETVRQFAMRRLADHPEERHAVAERHAKWYAHMASELGKLVETREQDHALAVLSPERNNLVVALRHLHASGNADSLGRLVLVSCPFWDASDTAADGRTWTTHALDLLGERNDALRAPLLMARANSSWLTGPMFMLDDDTNEALAIADRIGDRRTAGRARVALARTLGQVDPQAATELLALALSDSRAAGDHYTEAQCVSIPVGYHMFRGDILQGRAAADAAEPFVRAVHGGNALTGFNAYRSTLWHYEADVERCRSTFDPTSPNFVAVLDNTFGQRMMVRVGIAADCGEEGPAPEHIEERIAHFLRIENYFAAMTLTIALCRELQVRHRNHEALALADRAGTTVPIPHWPATAAVCALATGDIDGARTRLAGFDTSSPLSGVWIHLAASVVEVLLARHDGELAKAEATAHDGLALAVEHGYSREIVDTFEMLAGLAVAQGSWAHAARLAGAAHEQRESHPLKASTEPIRSMLAADLATARNALGDEAFDAAFDEGRGLTRDDAVAYAQRMRGERSRPTLGWASLTPTERRVVDLARQGHTNPQIATELLMGTETVKTHLSRVYAKLGVANRTKLAAFVPPPD